MKKTAPDADIRKALKSVEADDVETLDRVRTALKLDTQVA